MARMMTVVDGERDTVGVEWVKTRASRPKGLEALFELERMVLRKGRRCGADAVDKSGLSAPPRGDWKPEIIIDFTGAERDATCSPQLYLRPLYNGRAGEDAALAAILAGDLPRIEIRNEISGEILDAGRPSAEVADGLSGALDTVMARTMTLLKAVLSGKPRRFAHPIDGADPTDLGSPVSYVFLGLARAIAKRIYRLCCYAPHWHIGWRYTDDGGIWTSRDLSGFPWAVIADPGHRFYADPFPVNWQGRAFVFFEDLDHRVGKGTISAVEFDGTGPKGPVIHVLEEP